MTALCFGLRNPLFWLSGGCRCRRRIDRHPRRHRSTRGASGKGGNATRLLIGNQTSDASFSARLPPVRQSRTPDSIVSNPTLIASASKNLSVRAFGLVVVDGGLLSRRSRRINCTALGEENLLVLCRRPDVPGPTERRQSPHRNIASQYFFICIPCNWIFNVFFVVGWKPFLY